MKNTAKEKKASNKKIAASKTQRQRSPAQQGGKNILPLLMILLVSFIAFLPIMKNGFVNLDDDKYILNNALVRSVDLPQIFSQYVQGNYHPLTMLVYSIEYQLFGLEPAGYHVVNLLLHLLNIILVFNIISLLTKRKEIAIVVALLFGIHPLHVESVAWASELKDLLYSCFFLASWLCYLRYLQQLQKKFYFYCIILFFLALLSKAMAASLPVVLLLTDYFMGRKLAVKAWLEKLPLFALAAIFGIVAILAQRSSGAIQDMQFFSLAERIVFACYGFITYLIRLVIPTGLSAYYPYPIKTNSGIAGWYYIYPGLLLALIGLVFYSLRRTKKIFFAVVFFAITVFLVLQLLPVGNTIMADRYTYIPSVGIFYLAGEGVYQLWKKPGWKWITAGGVAIATIIFSVITYQRCIVWNNSISLWNDVISRNQTIPTAYNNRGMALEAENKIDSAFFDYNRAIELQPNFSIALNNRANILMNRQQYDKALGDYDKAIRLQPDFAEAYNGRGVLFMREKKFPEGIVNFKKAIALKPGFREVYYNLAISEYNSGQKDEACSHLQQAIDLGMPQAIDLHKQICK